MRLASSSVDRVGGVVVAAASLRSATVATATGKCCAATSWGSSLGVADGGDTHRDGVVVDVEDAQQADVDLAVDDHDDLCRGGVDVVAGEQVVDALLGEAAFGSLFGQRGVELADAAAAERVDVEGGRSGLGGLVGGGGELAALRRIRSTS